MERLRRVCWAVGIVFLLSVILTPYAAQGQNPEPIYSLVYNAEGVRVATFWSDGVWQIRDPLPNTHYDTIDAAYMRPTWQGDKLLVPFTPNNEGLYAELWAFDPATDDYQPLVTLFDVPQRPLESIQIVSISPDGRYAWLYTSVVVTSYLVDLQTGDIIYQTPCEQRALDWTDEAALVVDYGVRGDPDICTFEIFLLDIETG